MRKNVETMMKTGSRRKSDGFSCRCRICRIAIDSTDETIISATTQTQPFRPV